MSIRDIIDRSKDGVTNFVGRWRRKLFRRKKPAQKEPGYLSEAPSFPLTETKTTPPQRAATANSAQSQTDDIQSLLSPVTVPAKHAHFGTGPVVRTLYGKRNVRGNLEQVDSPPKQISRAAAMVFKIRFPAKLSVSDDRRALKHRKIAVKNPLLLAALEPVVRRENVHLDISLPPVLKAPFRELCFRQEEIAELHRRAELSDDLVKGHSAVVLLDEADVLTAERHASEIRHNELVSIFLRELEDFRGVLFLTTNLPRSIDQAFRSRVSMHLVFGELERRARELNGREIKNAVETDRAWYDYKRCMLMRAMMRNTIKQRWGALRRVLTLTTDSTCR